MSSIVWQPIETLAAQVRFGKAKVTVYFVHGKVERVEIKRHSMAWTRADLEKKGTLVE